MADENVDHEFEEEVEYEEVVEEVWVEDEEDAESNVDTQMKERQTTDATMDDNAAFEDDNHEDDDGFGHGDDDDGFGYDDDDDGFEDDAGGWGDADDINNDNAIMTGAKQTQFESSIPTITQTAIDSNCDEISMLPLFAASSDLKSRSRVGAMVAIRVSNLTNITAEQLEVWGLTEEFPFIALRFEFGPFYLNEAKLPKVEVGMCSTLSADEALRPFRLSWTINERLSNSMLTNSKWPPHGIDMKKIPVTSKINELMESSAKEYALCLQALRQYKGDEQQALEALLNEVECRKMMQQLPSIAACRAKFEDIMSNVSMTRQPNSRQKQQTLQKQKSLQEQYKNAADPSKILQLAEMYSMSLDAAALAYEHLGYDEAVSQLSNPDTRLHYVQNAQALLDEEDDGGDDSNQSNLSTSNSSKNRKKKGGFFKSFFGGNANQKSAANNGTNDDDDDYKQQSQSQSPSQLPDFQSMIRTNSEGGRIQLVQSHHFFRSIVLMEQHNFLLQCLCFALKVLLNGNKYCMICDKELAFAGLKPTICSDRFCQWRHDQIGLGFSLSAELLNRPEICDLLISMTYSASNAGRIHFFFPHGVRGLDDETQNESFLLSPKGSGACTEDEMKGFDADKFKNGEAGQPKPDVAKLKRVIDACPAVDDMQAWAKQGDVVLKKELSKIDALLYPLLIWIITSNRCHLRRLNESERIKAIDTEYQFALCSATPQREKDFQQLRARNSSFLAWHGSPMGNWHSILRMGLRNYSKTKHQANGAAYGSGIYFGKNFSLSWGYCRPGTNPGWSKSRFGVSMSCMALCEICYHSDDAHHHRGKKDVYAENYDADKAAASAQPSTGSDWNKTTSKQNRWVKTSGIYVVDQDECVMTRFFLIFPKTSGYKSVDANSLQGSLPNVVARSSK